MAGLRTVLEWIAAAMFGLFGLLGLEAVLSGKIVEGQIASATLSAGSLICCGLMAPILWMRLRSQRWRVVRYGAVILLVTVASLAPMRVKMVVQLPDAASHSGH